MVQSLGFSPIFNESEATNAVRFLLFLPNRRLITFLNYDDSPVLVEGRLHAKINESYLMYNFLRFQYLS